MSGGGSEQREEAQRARQEEAARERRVSDGTAMIRRQFGAAFNQPYYERFAQAGHDYYTPLIQDQYQNSLDSLKSALARNGLSKSTAGNMQEDRINREQRVAEGQVTEQIQNQMNARKTDVANQESVAVGQLQSSADPASASRQAANLINTQKGLPGWSPLGQVFTDASAFLANQGEAERGGNPRYNMGVSQWGNNSRRYLQNVGN